MKTVSRDVNTECDVSGKSPFCRQHASHGCHIIRFVIYVISPSAVHEFCSPTEIALVTLRPLQCGKSEQPSLLTKSQVIASARLRLERSPERRLPAP